MKLSILIPARNEEFLKRTIEDIFEHAEGDIEVMVELDGYKTDPNNWHKILTKIDDPRLKIIRSDIPVGQRKMTNILASQSIGDYLMKLDAHCSMSQGFDVKMMQDMTEDTLLVPSLCNLHVYNWLCPSGHKMFQHDLIKECNQCGSKDLKKEIVWQIISKPCRSNFIFDTKLHFQYAEEDLDGLLTESMSIQGSCFMVSRKKYFELNICDEAFGSWGQQGVETACKTWLSGGRVLCTKKAFYGHFFQEKMPNPVEKTLFAQQFSKDLFLNDNWPLAIHPFRWLIEKFNFPMDWTEEILTELTNKEPIDNQNVV